MSVKEQIRKFMWKLCGLQKLQDQIDTQYYFINSYFDITKAPQATGDLYLLQKADVCLMKVFDAICKRYGFTYWLEFSTLIGAVRHKGFIPWDDDQDVSMPRDDYERAKKQFPEIFSKYGIDAYWGGDGRLERICIGYKHQMTGTWIDVFPVESMFYISKTDISNDTIIKNQSQIIEELRKRVKELWKAHVKHYSKKQFAKINEIRDKLEGVRDKETIHYLYSYPNTKRYWLLNESDIFPLIEIPYGEEEYKFPAPRNYDSSLTQVYGDYMSFPKSGILHHDEGRGPLCEWHKKYGIDMNDVIDELNDIYMKINGG